MTPADHGLDNTQLAADGELTPSAAPPSDAAPGPGDMLGGRFQIEAELGRGGWGVVYRALDVVAGEPVAIKLLARAAHSTEAVQRFRRELRTARKVSHPGVVRTHDIMELSGQLALSMELVEGETLAARLARSGPLAAAELAQVATDLARALAAAHEAGVVHRDLKPANIILRASDGRAVITDFGISRLHSDSELAPEPHGLAESGETRLTRDGVLIGTPLYMAPEQLSGGNVGQAADVYALGVTLFEAATGRVPNAAVSLRRLIDARLTPVPPLAAERADLDAALCAQLDRCLAVDAAARPTTTALKLQLELLIGAATAPHPTLAPRRPRLKVGLATLSIVLFAAVPAALLSRPLPARERRVAVVVTNLGPAADAWLAPALRNLLRHHLTERELRFETVAEPAQANVLVPLAYRRLADGVELSAELQAVGGRPRPLVTVRAASVAQALDRVIERLGQAVGEGQAVRGPDEEEQVDMARLGTASFAAYRAYSSAVDEVFGAIYFNDRRFRQLINEAHRLDPGWAHPYALELYTNTDGIGERVNEALARVDSGRDPEGRAMLQAKRLLDRAQPAQAVALLDPIFARGDHDLLLGWAIGLAHDGGGGTAQIAVFRMLTERRPDLQFGVNLEGELRVAGRAGEILELQQAWLARAPQNEQALSAQVEVDLARGHVDEAIGFARRVSLLYGPTHSVILCDALIVADQLEEAGELARAMLTRDSNEREYGWARLGQIALLSGRFTEAQRALERALAQAKLNDAHVGQVEASTELLTLATALGDRQAQLRALAAFETVLDPVQGRETLLTLRYRRELVSGRCPGGQPGASSDEFAEEARQRVQTRLGAQAGCSACAAVVRDGLSAHERSMESLFSFGVCAEQTGDLELARQALTQVRRVQTGSLEQSNLRATAQAVLARFHLGRVLARLGQPADARAEYRDFLSHWGAAEPAPPEVAAARQELAALR